MASSLNAQRCEDFENEDFEIFVGNLPYSEDLTYDDYRKKRGLFSRAWNFGRPWKLEDSYIGSLEECLTNALESISEISLSFDNLPINSWEENHQLDVHRIVNPLTYDDPKEVTESNHFRPYAFVKCVNGIKGRLLLKAGKDGIMFKGSILQLAISNWIPLDQPKNFREEIVTNSKKNMSASLHPLAITSSYLDDISWHIIRKSFIDVPKLDDTENRKFEEQKELNEKISNAKGMYLKVS